MANPQTEGPLWNGSWPEYAAVMDPAVGAVLSGDLSIDDFAATICDEANKAFTGVDCSKKIKLTYTQNQNS